MNRVLNNQFVGRRYPALQTLDQKRGACCRERLRFSEMIPLMISFSDLFVRIVLIMLHESVSLSELARAKQVELG